MYLAKKLICVYILTVYNIVSYIKNGKRPWFFEQCDDFFQIYPNVDILYYAYINLFYEYGYS